MKKDFSPGSNPECHTLRKAIHERIAHSSVWPRCECPWSAQYSDGFHGRRLSGTNRPTWNEFPAEHFLFRPRTFGHFFCWISALAFSCPKKPSRLIRRKSESEKDGLLSVHRKSIGIPRGLPSNISYFIINIQSHAEKKKERLLVSFHFLKKNGRGWGFEGLPTFFN